MVYEKLHDRLVKMSADLIALLAGQENVVAAWQLPTARVRAARRAVRSRRWRRITTRTYLAGPAKPTEQQRLWAAVLHCGEHARLSGRAALNLHGWTLESEPPYDVVVPAGVQPARRPSWIRLHRVSMTPTGPAATPPRTSVHVATAHAAAWARSEREAMLVVISALQQRLTTPAHLLSALAGLPKLRRRRLIADMVQEFRDGAHSLNELDFGTLCRRFSLPEPRRQQRMFDEGGACGPSMSSSTPHRVGCCGWRSKACITGRSSSTSSTPTVRTGCRWRIPGPRCGPSRGCSTTTQTPS